MSYRQEATTRIVYFSVAVVIALAVSLFVGLIALLVTSASNDDMRSTVFAYSVIIAFAITCSVTVYQADRRLDKKFNQNPS